MEDQQSNGIGRRELLRRLAAGAAGASVALPGWGHAATLPASMPHTAMQAMPDAAGSALGAAEPPDPSLSSKDWTPRFFDEHQNETVVVLSDLVIPATDTPGAKAAEVNRFIDMLLSAQDSETQKEYIQALAWLDGHCLVQYSKPFTRLDPAEQADVLTLLTHPDRMARRHHAEQGNDPDMDRGAELFAVIKSSIVDAYYSSEIGLLQELKYQTNPFQTGYPGCEDPEKH